MGNADCWISVAIVVIVFGSGFTFFHEDEDLSKDDGIGSHGCLIASGYFWNETEKACVRDLVPEGIEKSRYQVDSFETCISAGHSVLPTHPRRCETPRGDIFYDDAVE